MPYYNDGPYAYFHDYSAVHDGSITTAKLDPSLRLTIDRTFDTVADMQAATDLVAGMTCRTNGFHSEGDGGAAYYVVGESGTANGMDVLALQDSLLATLVVTEPYVTPEMFGAYGDGTNDDTLNLSTALSSGHKVIATGVYKVTTLLGNLANVVLDGYATGKIVFKNQTDSGEFIVNFTGKPEIRNITFEKSFDGDSNHHGGIEVSNTDYGIIDNCKFINDQHDCNGYLDIYTNNHNLNVSNCYFYIDTTVNGVVNSGCINVREQGGGSSSNIKFLGCVFKSKSHDEVISPRVGNLGGSLSYTTFENCTFELLSGNTAPYFITGKNALMTEYIGCMFIRNPTNDSGTHYVYGEVEGSTLFLTDSAYIPLFSGCRFDLNGGMSAFAFMDSNYVPRAQLKGCTINADDISLSGAEFTNCKVNIANSHVVAGSCVWLDSCDVNVSATTGNFYNAVMEIRNSHFVVESADSNSYLFYQPVSDTHQIVENSRIVVPHSICYMGSSTVGSNPVVRYANSVVKAVRGTFGTPANNFVDSYIVNCIWDGFNPSIPSTYRVSNNVQI